MKRILIPTAIAAMSVIGVAGFAQAGSSNAGAYPPSTTIAVLPPPPPVLTVPPSSPPLPVTGSDFNDILAVGAVALAAGGGLVLVAKSRRRSAQSAS